eukprot:Gb_27486 [translate_table: standard]
MGKGGEGCLSAVGGDEELVQRVAEVYEKISRLESLEPCAAVNALFTQLVRLCTPASGIEVARLKEEQQLMRRKLISLCGEAEGLLESHYAVLLARFPRPLAHLHLFPYYQNYTKLAQLESQMLVRNGIAEPKRLAFVGSGPMPLTSIVMAMQHMPTTHFHNYDVNPLANAMASALVAAHPELSRRMSFHTSNILHANPEQLARCDVVFLAALVGMEKPDKDAVLNHLAKHMAPGAALLVRSARGARAFLYPVVHPHHLSSFHFQILSVFHPTDDVINSVILARKCKPTPVPLPL